MVRSMRSYVILFRKNEELRNITDRVDQKLTVEIVSTRAKQNLLIEVSNNQ